MATPVRARFARTGLALLLAAISAGCGQASDYSGAQTDDAPSSAAGDGADGNGADTDGADGNGADGAESSGDDTQGADSSDDQADDETDDAADPAAGDDPETDGDADGEADGDAGDGDDDAGVDGAIRLLEPQIVNTFPHDGNAFTQGLEYLDGVLFESTGLYGESGRRRVGLTNGVVSSSLPLSDDLFGAGLALVGEGALIQLTWKEGVAIVADPITLQEFDRFTFEGEGWGLCDLGEQLVMSDGTATLTFRDPMSFAAVGTVSVTRDGAPVERLNELACVEGLVWANVWLTNEIMHIDPATGNVVAIVDATDLVPTGLTDEEDVLNGIAYNPVDGTFFLTGKRWDVLYEVDFVER